MALTKDRNTAAREGNLLVIPMAVKKVFAGSLVAFNAAGFATPGAVATTLRAAGRAEETVDNLLGSAGDLFIKVKRGVFKFKNSGADPIAQANVLTSCYIEDDETVAATSGTNTRSIAGKVLEVESDGVWVEIL